MCPKVSLVLKKQVCIEDSYRFMSEKLESVSRILLISVKVLEVLFQKI